MGKFLGKYIHKNLLLWAIAAAVLIVSFILIVRVMGHKESDKPHTLNHHFQLIDVDQFYKVKEISEEKTLHAIELLKNNQFQEGIDELIDAINICPINTYAYQLLARTYLDLGKEEEMYDVIDRSGDSYADLNDVINMIDDKILDKIPLDGPQDKVFLSNFPENKKMAISYMFDDGEASIYEHLNIFEKYGFRATFPIVAGFVGTSPRWGTWEDWRDAANRGFEIANHSMYHRDLSLLSGKDLEVSINQSDALIEKKIGREVTAFVFPGGNLSNEGIAHALQVSEVIRSIKFLRSYYGRTIGLVYGGPYFSLNSANKMIDIGIKRHLWIIAKGHGITVKPGSFSFKPINPDLLDEHLNYVHSKLNDIYVDTFSHVFEYLKLRLDTKIKINNYSLNSADFELDGDSPEEKITRPLTVVIKGQPGVNVSAQTTSGRQLKAWVCNIEQLCVDVDSYNENIHVQW